VEETTIPKRGLGKTLPDERKAPKLPGVLKKEGRGGVPRSSLVNMVLHTNRQAAFGKKSRLLEKWRNQHETIARF